MKVLSTRELNSKAILYTMSTIGLPWRNSESQSKIGLKLPTWVMEGYGKAVKPSSHVYELKLNGIRNLN